MSAITRSRSRPTLLPPRVVFMYSSENFRMRPQIIRGELNSPVAEWRLKGLTDSCHLRRFFGALEYLGGEPNSSVVEWLNKGAMSLPTSTNK
eukprot:1187000-Prorocentrum_minimum.AAC.1